ncbi:MAG: polar amino acid ABC transporter permease [Anaerolineales bacterium]|nr:MAG: polar amino acid ABC transporter permease [Anaerolineales bacterium]
MANAEYSNRIPLWRDERVLKILAQVVSSILVLGILYWLINNFMVITRQRGMPLTYGFLDEAAGFPIKEAFIPYAPTMTFGRAVLVGLVNTLVVSALGIVFATVLGFIVGLMRLSSNWLISRIALAYIEFHRNIPLLVLLFLWYFGVFNKLPAVKQSFAFPDVIYINQRGFYITWPHLAVGGLVFLGFVIAGVILAVVAWIVLRRIREVKAIETYYGWVSLGLLILVPLIGWFVAGGKPLVLDIPVLKGFNFTGGLRLSPEFAALLIGLATYTSAFIAEVIRSGIQAVHKGQIEAAKAVGLRYSQILSLIIVPQALRVVIPPLISQYLNLTKNSSLALVIGFQELFAIGKVTINQAGRAVPVFLLIMAIYLAISLLTSVVLNFYNKRVQLIER